MPKILGWRRPGKIGRCWLFIYSPIAQSVERVTVNHDVVGSSPTWGAKKKSRSNDLLFLFVSELSSQSITSVSITMELVKEAPAVVPTERPLKKHSSGLFLGRSP